MISLYIIAALDRNLGIGYNGKLPWNIPEDLAHFKEQTSGHIVIMGSNTFESLPVKSRPLPNRYNVVLTRSRKGETLTLRKDSLEFCGSLESVLSLVEQKSSNYDKAFVIGGRQIYDLFMPYVYGMYITVVDEEFDTDTKFPLSFSDISSHFDLISSRQQESKSGVQLRFEYWERKPKNFIPT